MATEITVVQAGLPQSSGTAPSENTGAAAPKPYPTEKKETGSAARTEQIQDAVDRVAGRVQNAQRDINFSIDRSTDRVVVKVVDSETDQVIRQIPAEEMLALARHMEELTGDELIGLLLQSRA